MSSQALINDLAARANSDSDADAMVAMWDAVFELDAWYLPGRLVKPEFGAGKESESEFQPAVSMFDGIPMAACFTSEADANGFIEQQHLDAGIVRTCELDGLSDTIGSLAAMGVGGLVFNEGEPPLTPFLATLVQLLDMLPVHRPGYGR